METTNKNPEGQVLDSTTVEQVDVNIDEIFGMPGAENVMLPEEQNSKPKSIFHKETVDNTFFDNPNATSEEKKQIEQNRLRLSE